MATVSQYISSTTSATQDGTQTAEVVQQPAAGGDTISNVVRVTQSVSQSSKTGDAQTQNAYQSALVTQTAAGSGSNQSDVNQSQLQKAYGGSVQSQNTGPSSVPDCVSGDPGEPNECVDVNQHSAAGTNTSKVVQSINEDMNSGGLATQTQGRAVAGTAVGGLDGHVHQDTQSGSSFNDANQSKNQTETAAPGSTQAQYDPVSCCGQFSQFGGSGNVENIAQSSALQASNPGAVQTSQLIGTSKSPYGTCTVKQNAAIDDDSKTNSASLTPCPELTLTTSCSSGTIVESVVRGDACSTAESTLTKAVRNVSTEDETFGTTTTASGSSGEGEFFVPGDTLEYRIIYSNTGKGEAKNVVVTDPISDSTAFVSGSCTPSCTFADGVVSWNLGTVEAGGTRQLFFRVTIMISEFTSITNAATAVTDGDTATSNTTTVTPQLVESSLTLEVRNLGTSGDNFDAEWGSATSASTSQVLEYRIVYTNSGSAAAHNVWVSTAIPAETSVIDAIPVPGPGETTLLTSYICPQSVISGMCFLGYPEGTVEPGADDTLRTVLFTVKVDKTCPANGPISYTASGHTDEDGTITSNATSVDLVCLE